MGVNYEKKKKKKGPNYIVKIILSFFFSCYECFFKRLTIALIIINNDDHDVETHREKFLKEKKIHKEKDIKIIRKI